MQIGEENFLPGKEETRRNPDGFQEFLTQPDKNFPSRYVPAPIGTASNNRRLRFLMPYAHTSFSLTIEP